MNYKNSTARVFYGWWIVIAGLLIYATILGCYQSFGVFFKPIQNEFGWGRAVTATSFFIGSITMGILAPIAGILSDRYGPRLIITIAGILGATGYFLASHVQTQWQLFGSFILMGTGGTFFVPLLAVVSRWFTLRRGLALGLTGIGGGIGQATIPPLAQLLIDQFGWRYTYITLAVILSIVVISSAQILRSNPRDKGLLPYGEKNSEDSKHHGHQQTQVTAFKLKQVIHIKAFWMILLAAFFGHLTYQMTWVHLVPYVTDPDIGLSSMVGASLVSTIGWSNVAGKILIGSLSDRIGPRATLIVCYSVSGVAMLWLLVARELWMLYIFSFALGFFYGGLIPLHPALVGATFGLSSIGAISGGVQAGTSTGGALGSVLGGFIYDVSGGYFGAFAVGAILYFTSMILVAMVMKPRETGLQP